MAFAFSPDRIRAIRQRPRQSHATLLLESDGVVVGSLRKLLREYDAHDEEGQVVGRRRTVVTDTGADGELIGVIVTILKVERLDVYEGRGLSLPLARGCGFRTVKELREDWIAQHPRSPLAQAVYFMLGDHRDRDQFLQYHSQGGDYTYNRSRAIDDLPTLSRAQTETLAVGNAQRHAKRVADVQRSHASLSLAQRMERIERGGEEVLHLARRDLAVIGQRLATGEKRIKKPGQP